MRQIFTWGLWLGLAQFTGSVAAEEANYFLLSYQPGASWNQSLTYEAQPGLEEHHEYIRQLHLKDLIVMGGIVGDGTLDSATANLSVMVLRTGSLEEAMSLASQDPGVQTRLVRAEVLPWSVNMSSMRFVRRRPQQTITDPDQSFSIKRVDPESRLNIEQ